MNSFRLFLTLCSLLSLLSTATSVALNPSADQWIALPAFSGGINTQFDQSSLPEGQLLTASNFIWRDGQLQVREGFYRFAAPLSDRSVQFMDVFSNTSGADYLMYSDGRDLWYRPEMTGASVALAFGRSNVGLVDTWGTVVGGDSILVEKWRSLFGTGEGLSMTIDGVDYTVSKILLDTLIYLTSSAGTTTDKAYSIDYGAINIQSRVVVSDNYWIYSNTGKSYFNRPDSFVIVDSLAGFRSKYTTVSRRCSPMPTLYFSETVQSITDDYSGQFLRITSNPISPGSTKNPVTAAHPFYMSYPIRTSSATGTVSTYGAAFQPDSTTDQYFTIEELVFDSTSVVVYTVDSVRMQVGDSTNLSCSGKNALYLKIYDSDFDSSTFITGDWFCYPRYNFTVSNLYDSTGSAGGSYLTLPQTAQFVMPVVGGFMSTDGALYASWPAAWATTRSDPSLDVDTNNVKMTFYRMKKNVEGSNVGGYEFAVLHNERVFECRSSEKDRIYWSEPFLPDSFLAGSVVIVDQANPLVIAAKQWSDLVVYTTAGSWRIIADATAENYGTEKLNNSRGCVARGSFVNIDNVHYGLAADGFWECDGNEPRIISDAVASYFTDSISQANYANIRAGYDIENDNIWISSPDNDLTLVYHRPTKSWWRQSFVGGSYSAVKSVAVSDSVRFLVGGTDSSTIYVRGGRFDDGANVTASLKTPYMNFGEPIMAKRLKSLLLTYDSEVAAAVSVFGYRDFGTTAFDTVTFTSAAVWAQKWLRVPDARYRGNNLSIGFSIANASMLKLTNLRVQVMPLGEEE